MSHGVDDVPIFVDDFDRKRFLDPLHQLVELGILIVHAFVLMVTHFHILCETPSVGLSILMQKFLGQYVQGFNRRHDRRGHLLRSRYKALLVEDGEYFLECSRYIHFNPVKAGICSIPEDYPWSSYGQYVGSSDMFSWVCASKTLDYFPNNREYEGFVLKGRQVELRNPFDQAIRGIVFGSSEFAQRMGVVIPKPKKNQKESALSITAIEDAVNQIFPGLTQFQHNRIMVYALRCFTGKTCREIASLANRTPSAVTNIWNAINKQISCNRQLQQKMASLRHSLDKTSPP